MSANRSGMVLTACQWRSMVKLSLSERNLSYRIIDHTKSIMYLLGTHEDKQHQNVTDNVNKKITIAKQIVRDSNEASRDAN